MPFLPETSFYKCENILVSIQNQDNIVEITIFSEVESQNQWKIDGNWDQKWRHVDKGLYYGGAKRTNGDMNISIFLYNERICEFSSESLK